uniref:Uncharacterized protein n=1 Tax=Anguilla anguilla TaxID=7936 RepID=A0A0E9P842_ANGAN
MAYLPSQCEINVYFQYFQMFVDVLNTCAVKHHLLSHIIFINLAKVFIIL